MKPISKITLLSAALAAAFLLSWACTPRDRYIVFNGYAQGGTYTVKINMKGEDGMIKKKPEEIRNDVDSILQAIDKSLSGYNRNSLLSRFNAGDAIIPDHIFTDIYGHGYRLYEECGGILDVASGPLFDLWGFGFRSGDFPDSSTVDEIRLQCGMQRFKKDIAASLADDGTLRLADLLVSYEEDKPTPSLNYNAIAQGYSCDAVAEYLYGIGIKDMLVDIGEIYCDGRNPSERPWSLGIDKPIDGNNEPGSQLQITFKVPEGPHGVVTSGNYRKYYIRDGKKYSHSINPKTGYPVSHNLLSATIIAPDALTADAYATYCMVIGLEEAIAFIEKETGVEGFLIYDENGVFRTWQSGGFAAGQTNGDL